jgi:hypothetical protein
MFNENDFDKMSEDNTDSAPDGLVDASDYANDMISITNILSELDYDDMTSRMHGMMNIINHTYDDNGELDHERVTGVIISLCFHVINVINSLEEDSRQDYFEFTKNEVIPVIIDESSTLPYWDLEETDGE